LQATIPHLTRSSLHRCLKRHAISRLPEIAGDKVAKKPFKRYPIGYFHLDIAEVRTEEGKLYLFVAIDRTSKFVFAQLHEAANVKSAVGFLQALIEAVPYTIHIVLTDNGIQFGDMPSRRTGPTARYRLHMFDRICREHGIEHRLTKPNHPWTNGQVERMNRTLKEATVRRYHYETHQQLREHLEAFLNAYNFAKRLKTLRGLTPYEHICKAWADQPRRFRYDPTHLTSGLNSQVVSRQLVVTGRDTPEVFEPVERSLDAPAQLVEAFAERKGLFPVVAVGNDRLGAALMQLFAQLIAVIGRVAKHPF
jgi:transposase-like protein